MRTSRFPDVIDRLIDTSTPHPEFELELALDRLPAIAGKQPSPITAAAITMLFIIIINSLFVAVDAI